MKASRVFIDQVVFSILECHELKRLTKYVNPKLVMNATRVRALNKRSKQDTIVLTIGKPNYLQRKLIKLYLKAGVYFPVSKMEMKWFEKKGKKK